MLLLDVCQKHEGIVHIKYNLNHSNPLRVGMFLGWTLSRNLIIPHAHYATTWEATKYVPEVMKWAALNNFVDN